VRQSGDSIAEQLVVVALRGSAVAGKAAESLRERGIGVTKEVDGKPGRPLGDAVGVVGLRQPDAVPLRPYARLAVEPDQAARPLLAVRKLPAA
jgi:hypothetical protein